MSERIKLEDLSAIEVLDVLERFAEQYGYSKHSPQVLSEKAVKEYSWYHKKQKTHQSIYSALKHCFGDDTNDMIKDFCSQFKTLEPIQEDYLSDVIYCTTQYLDLPDKEVALLNKRIKDSIIQRFGKLRIKLPDAFKELILASKEFVQWFDYLSAYQNENLGKGLKEAEENWGNMVEPSPPIDRLKKALDECAKLNGGGNDS